MKGTERIGQWKRMKLANCFYGIETVTVFDGTRSELFVRFSTMRAFLLKLNFGLRDLSYMELERHAATHRGPRCGTNPSQKAVSCYFERFGNKCVTAEGTQVRLHVHKEENGVKVGAVCRKQSSLEIIFSIFQCPCGDFILSVVGKLKQRFGLLLVVNSDILPLDEKDMRVLRHGDIIRGFFSIIPSFRIMFLLSDSSHVRETQTSLLLSFPWLVLKNIAKFLPPFDMMQDLVPVCRLFYDLMKDGSSWTHVKFYLRDGMPCQPFGHFQDFCKVVYKHVRKLSLMFSFDSELDPLWPRNILRPIFQHYDWSKLEVLEIDTLDTNEEAWSEFLRRSGKKLIHLEMLSVECITLADILLEASKAGHVLFPKCRELRLRLKKLHLNHAILHDMESLISNSVLLRDPHLRRFPDFLGSGVLSSLHTYQLPVKLDAGGWKLAGKMGIFAKLETLSMTGEIFNNMPPANEKIIFFPKHKTVEKSPGGVFKELRSCSKLRGLILKVPDNLPLETLGQLSQPLDSLRFLKPNSTRHGLCYVKSATEVPKILRAVKVFKRLKNLVLFSKTEMGSGKGFSETMQGCLGPVSSLHQVTFVCELGPDLRHQYVRTLQVVVLSSLKSRSKQCSKMRLTEAEHGLVNHVPLESHKVRFSAIFNPRLDRPSSQPRPSVLLLDIGL
ncbi:unnamed protein product [Notodromas monacha]|uniref:F-box domain-containing protein n=1 Tax=Notodromas monacha TaxID=399045 RepID=A0A7R9BTT9_9CRUS|nr:unnamed protein product [Notodromas monacha]CAG0920076.1 unnamed protein product [Notodromas monacha]